MKVNYRETLCFYEEMQIIDEALDRNKQLSFVFRGEQRTISPLCTDLYYDNEIYLIGIVSNSMGISAQSYRICEMKRISVCGVAIEIDDCFMAKIDDFVSERLYVDTPVFEIVEG